jgi:hypothetical protein
MKHDLADPIATLRLLGSLGKLNIFRPGILGPKPETKLCGRGSRQSGKNQNDDEDGAQADAGSAAISAMPITVISPAAAKEEN